MNFEAFCSDITTNGWKVHGTEVYENGVLTHSFGDTENLHEIYSVTKSVLSIAVAIAYDEGKFDLERCVLDYLPKENIAKMSPSQKKDFEKIPIRRLLTMTVEGLPFRPEGENWLDFALSSKIENPEEKVFNYSNISAYLVGVALTEAIGQELGVFIEERIFKPLGIEKYEYSRSPEGYFYGASGMKLSVSGLSKLGLLFYNGGMANGKRIISEEYVKMATSVQHPTREGGYGFFVWKYRSGFSLNGKWKQKCYVLPDEGILVSYLSDIQDDSHDLLQSMEKNILGIS
ncbi:MAG: beta-lactamase family protein [Clostridiales bacterium]|nr:beta-lactamase family protein [Clostridiales bacterium]